MLDKLIYISSNNRTIAFGEGNILINTNDFRDYEWKYQQSYKRITTFSRDITSKRLPILLYGENVRTIANNIFETIEYDILNKKYGKLYSGDYYMSGYFTESTKPSYTADGFMKLELTFVSDKPYWIKETTYIYRPDSISGAGLGYPYDYPYDYLPSVGTAEIVNPSFIDQNIKIVIHGACTNPKVMIDEHVYELSTELSDNEYATINTAEKTITKTESDGTVVNIFNSRSRSSYIFEKIPVGTHIISALPSTNVDLTILEERSEPQW